MAAAVRFDYTDGNGDHRLTLQINAWRVSLEEIERQIVQKQGDDNSIRVAVLRVHGEAYRHDEFLEFLSFLFLMEQEIKKVYLSGLHPFSLVPFILKKIGRPLDLLDISLTTLDDRDEVPIKKTIKDILEEPEPENIDISGSEISFDYLPQENWNLGEIILQWLVPSCPTTSLILSDTSAASAETTIRFGKENWSQLMVHEKLEELEVNLYDDENQKAVLESLPGCTLQKLSICNIEVNPSYCNLLSSYLRNPLTSAGEGLQALHIEISDLLERPGCYDPLDEDQVERMFGVVARALQVNTNLTSFRFFEPPEACLSREVCAPLQISEKATRHFERALRENTTITDLDLILSDVDSDAGRNIAMYVKLNKAGRGRLLEGLFGDRRRSDYSNDNLDWISVMGEVSDDLSCLFYLLQTNPMICNCAGTPGRDGTTLSGAKRSHAGTGPEYPPRRLQRIV